MAKKKKVTLSDIAEEAGVSTGLVSFVLNGKGRASPEVRNRVLKLLKKSGFKPRVQRRHLVFVTDRPTGLENWQTVNYFECLNGITRFLQEQDIELRVAMISGDLEKAMRSINRAQPGGVLVMTGTRALETVCSAATAKRIPVVQIGYDAERPECNAVVVDSYTGAHQAVQHLVRLGHSRIATIRWGAGQIANSNKRHAGYLTALADAGIKVRKEYIIEAPLQRGSLPDPTTQRPGRFAIEKLLALREPPTALFLENNFICASLLYPMRSDKGTRPKRLRSLDMAMFEDIPMSVFETPLAGMLDYPSGSAYVMRSAWGRIGHLGAQTLVDVINDRSGDPRVLGVPPTLCRYNDFRYETVEPIG